MVTNIVAWLLVLALVAFSYGLAFLMVTNNLKGLAILAVCLTFVGVVFLNWWWDHPGLGPWA